MTLRVVTLNLWGVSPPLDRRLALAEAQLRALAPDVICLQEVKPLDASPDADPGAASVDASGDRRARTTAHHLARTLGYRCVYEPALGRGAGGHDPAPARGDAARPEEEGLAILSRHPVDEHRVLVLPEARPDELRILLSARIAAPAAPVWCHTTHLHWRLDDGLAREKQVVAIDQAIRAIAATKPEGPAGLVQLLCGDCNATPAHDEIRFLGGMVTLDGRRTHYQDAFAHIHPRADGHTWTLANPILRAKGTSLDMDRRIDYVFVSTRHKDGRGTVHDARVVLDQHQGGLAASDHYGVLADVQIAPDAGIAASS